MQIRITNSSLHNGRETLGRDVRTVQQVGDLVPFQAFMRALAARSGTLLNLRALGRDLGLTNNTVKAWLSVLEASQQIVLLRPYFANTGRRLVKTYRNRGVQPRISFWRTGRGEEVDFEVETADRLLPLEVKTSTTPLPLMSL